MPTTPKPRSREYGWQYVWAWISIGALAVGSLAPWAKGPFGSSLSGLDGSNDGWSVLGAAVIAAIVLARIQIAPGRRVIGRVFLLLVMAGFSGLIAFVDRGNVSDKKLLEVGWGLNLTLVAAISLGLAAIAVYASRPSRRAEASDVEDTPA
jgi:hypothetical protein